MSSLWEPTLVWEDSWTKGWTAMLPVFNNNLYYLLSYKAGEGRVAIDRFNKGGEDGVTSTFNGTVLPKGLSSLAVLSTGDLDYLVSYMPGANAVLRVDSFVKGGTGLSDPWSETAPVKDWTAITPVYGGQTQYLLFYNAANGNAAIGLMNAKGAGFTNKASLKLDPGWTSFVGDSDYLLSYNKNNGKVRLDRLNAAGTAFEKIWSDTWTKGWTSFAKLNGAYLIYKTDNGNGHGRLAIEARKSDPHQGFTTLYDDDQWDKDFTSFVPFVLVNSTDDGTSVLYDFLCYKSQYNTVRIYKYYGEIIL